VKKEAHLLHADVYVVGGYVRDLLLGRKSNDIDFLTIGDGTQLAKNVADKLQGSFLSIFKTYGTAQVKYQGMEFEFVGARKESYQKDSRKPMVEIGTFEDDINRRDFTINALAIQLTNHNEPKIIDLFEGLQHLEEKKLITPLEPHITFSDDPLRMIRAARFATQLNFTISPDTLEAMKANAERIQIVSMERITDEIQKIMAASKPSIGWKILFDTKILHQFFPDFARMQGVEVINGKGHKDNFYHTLEVLDNVAAKSENIWLRWAALLHDIAKPPTKRFSETEGWSFHGHEDKGARMSKGIFKRLKLPLGEPLRFVENLVRLHLRPIALTKENISDAAIRRLIFDANEDLEDLMTLCRCDITTKSQEKKRKFQENLDFVASKIVEVENRDKIRNWQPPIDGNEIMELFGIPASREVGILKGALKDAILDGVIPNDREEAKDFLIHKGKQLGLNAVKELC
jgi:poly(A) polymerase